MKSLHHKFSVLAALLVLGGCSGAKEQLGLTKPTPDEFAVVKRAPLAMPPNYSLRPPQPGAPRPQEQRTSEAAQRAVFGNVSGAQDSGISGSENALLQEAGATQAQNNIRQIVDSESREFDDSNKPVIDRLMGWNGKDAEGDVLNATEEAQRLKQEASQTLSPESVTEAPPPESIKKAPVKPMNVPPQKPMNAPPKEIMDDITAPEQNAMDEKPVISNDTVGGVE